MAKLPPADHRGWPLPDRPWSMYQEWHHLLFAHWAVPVEMLRSLIPAALEVDVWEGKAWVGVVPFEMKWVHPRYVLSVPWLSFFPELNVRTYVTLDGKPGIWFFSLEATNPIAVSLARHLFHLPYMNAQMSCEVRPEQTVVYHSRRTRKGAPPAEFAGSYRPIGQSYHADPGSHEHWLTERYALYSTNPNGHIYRGEIHHEQWDLYRAEADIQQNTMAQAAGITLPDEAPLLHYVEKQATYVWLLEQMR